MFISESLLWLKGLKYFNHRVIALAERLAENTKLESLNLSGSTYSHTYNIPMPQLTWTFGRQQLRGRRGTSPGRDAAAKQNTDAHKPRL